MLRHLIPLLVLVIIGYLYVSGTTTCLAPLTYRVGQVDARFHLSTTSMITALDEATAVWEKATKRELFATSSPKADLVLNFVFDNRQERIVSEESFRSTLDTKESTTAEIKAKYSSLSKAYDTLKSSYETASTHYEARLTAYNARVAAFNADANSAKDTYDTLTRERVLLEAELTKLQASNIKLASLARQINDISEKGNAVIEQYNAGVHEYNKQFGEPDEFTQGEYKSGPREIDIYSFKDRSELVNVLAHEFGHALGLDHVEGSSSIMYYLMADQPYPVQLSASDTTAFNQVCGGKQSIAVQVRSFINRYIVSYIYG